MHTVLTPVQLLVSVMVGVVWTAGHDCWINFHREAPCGKRVCNGPGICQGIITFSPLNVGFGIPEESLLFEFEATHEMFCNTRRLEACPYMWLFPTTPVRDSRFYVCWSSSFFSHLLLDYANADKWHLHVAEVDLARQKYTRYMPELCLTYMSELCHNHVWHMSHLCLKYVRHVPDICLCQIYIRCTSELCQTSKL